MAVQDIPTLHQAPRAADMLVHHRTTLYDRRVTEVKRTVTQEHRTSHSASSEADAVYVGAGPRHPVELEVAATPVKGQVDARIHIPVGNARVGRHMRVPLSPV